MAGYMTKQTHNVYEGEYANGAAAAVENGTLMVLNATGDALVLPDADTSTKILCKEVTTIYDGVTAFRCVMVDPAKLYYLVDNGFEYNDVVEYDLNTYATAVGKLLRAHPLHAGEEFVQTTSGLTAGTIYGVLATGLVGGTAANAGNQ